VVAGRDANVTINRNLNRNSVDDLCDAIARLQMRPADAALIRRAMLEYRANSTHTHIELMRVPGLARLWACLETTCALAIAGELSS
jgi:hypothetical protein